MTSIKCSHPQQSVEVRQEVIPTTDVLLTRTKPQTFCTKCESYLPIIDSPGREIVSFWFIRQDNLVRAQVVA